MTPLRLAIPRGPVLDWTVFRGRHDAGIPAVDDAPHVRFTSSGRAAIYQALRELRLTPGTRVLLPTYHCPTMVAPVEQAGLEPAFYGLGHDFVPQLHVIEPEIARAAGAIVVPHYFGHARSMALVRAWCDERGVALIEDCAHAYFGMAGELPVGAWGDFAVASATKFFPVTEAGVLASWRRRLTDDGGAPQGWRAEIKGWTSLASRAAAAGRLAGLGGALRWASAWLHHRRTVAGAARAPDAASAQPASSPDCDLARIGLRPLRGAAWLVRSASRARIIELRRARYRYLQSRLEGLPGARVLDPQGMQTVPYALPLWVEDPEPVYRALRALGMPVFRWDRLWPGTPNAAGDMGRNLSVHVLQLLCHQDLTVREAQQLADTVAGLLSRQGPSDPLRHPD